MIKIAPSILGADPMTLGRDVRKMVDAGCDWIHVDIMDGHFVPNISFGPAVVKALKRDFDTPLDVHLMISDPEKYAEVFVRAGADVVTVHAEAVKDLPALLKSIHALGAKTGVSLKPATGVDALRGCLPDIDMVLVMTVEPGFGGQKFMAEQITKIRELRALGYRGWIEADGGVSEDNLQALVDGGLDVAVMGTALYKSEDPAAMIRRIHEKYA